MTKRYAENLCDGHRLARLRPVLDPPLVTAQAGTPHTAVADLAPLPRPRPRPREDGFLFDVRTVDEDRRLVLSIAARAFGWDVGDTLLLRRHPEHLEIRRTDAAAGSHVERLAPLQRVALRRRGDVLGLVPGRQVLLVVDPEGDLVRVYATAGVAQLLSDTHSAPRVEPDSTRPERAA